MDLWVYGSMDLWVYFRCDVIGDSDQISNSASSADDTGRLFPDLPSAGTLVCEPGLRPNVMVFGLAELDLPQVAETMRKLESSVYARRRYENKVRTDPVLLEAHRKRGRENWRKQQELKTQQQAVGIASKLSFTLTL